MSKPKLLLIRYAAFGDFIYMSALLPFLFEKYDVHFEMNTKGAHLFHDDPRFVGKSYFAIEDYDPQDYPTAFEKRWQEVREAVKADHELNLNGTLEATCIAERFQPEFFESVGNRRVRFGVHGFYDTVFERAGIDMPVDLNTAGMWFSDEEMAWGEKWRARHKDQFVVIIPMAGSTRQKLFHPYQEIADAIIAQHDNAVVYFAGDTSLADFVPKGPRYFSMCNLMPIKQSVLMTKFADMVIGPETSLLAAAGMWGTPKIMFCTTSSVWQICQYHKNDFSVQADIWCSPCHRSIYAATDCHEMLKKDDGEPLYPACTKRVPVATILERVHHIHANNPKRSVSPL